MREMLRTELTGLHPAWLICLLLPLPALFFWQAEEGRSLALGCFFVGCTTVVAYSFRRELPTQGTTSTQDEPSLPRPPWPVKMLVLAAALFAEFLAFAALLMSLND